MSGKSENAINFHQRGKNFLGERQVILKCNCITSVDYAHGIQQQANPLRSRVQSIFIPYQIPHHSNKPPNEFHKLRNMIQNTHDVYGPSTRVLLLHVPEAHLRPCPVQHPPHSTIHNPHSRALQNPTFIHDSLLCTSRHILFSISNAPNFTHPHPAVRLG